MIPLTVIAGYLGAGKTHLVNRLLKASKEPIGICVNDFGELNIDAALIQNSRGTTLELTNGCICCQLNDDLGAALEDLASTGITRVIIEASGVALPEKIAAYGRNWPGYQLHKTYTLVDASNIRRWLDDKYVGALVATQMQQADELLVTKLDLLGPANSRHWSWMREALKEWQVLPNGALTDAQLQALFAPSEVQTTEAQAATASPLHRPNLVATCTAAEQPISADSIRRLLRTNPHVVRAKGWFTDATQRQYLLQHVAQQTNLEQQPKQQNNSKRNGLVFLHHESTALDLSMLTTQHLSSPTT